MTTELKVGDGCLFFDPNEPSYYGESGCVVKIDAVLVEWQADSNGKTFWTEKKNLQPHGGQRPLDGRLICSGKGEVAELLNGIEHSTVFDVCQVCAGSGFAPIKENTSEAEVEHLERERGEYRNLWHDSIIEIDKLKTKNDVLKLELKEEKSTIRALLEFLGPT